MKCHISGDFSHKTARMLTKVNFSCETLPLFRGKNDKINIAPLKNAGVACSNL